MVFHLRRHVKPSVIAALSVAVVLLLSGCDIQGFESEAAGSLTTECKLGVAVVVDEYVSGVNEDIYYERSSRQTILGRGDDLQQQLLGLGGVCGADDATVSAMVVSYARELVDGAARVREGPLREALGLGVQDLCPSENNLPRTLCL